MRRKKQRKQRKIIILSMVSLLCVMTIGYAAFQTNLNISAKGNIVGKVLTISKLKDKYCNQTSGDGLYNDLYEEDRCVYKGLNPNNYITFNDEKAGWRIVSIESDKTLKIIKIDNLGNRVFDAANARITEYCNQTQYGCNVWGSSTTMLDVLGNNVTTMKRQYNETNTYALPTEESGMAMYLNTTYYETLGEESKNQIDNHLWHVGPLATSSNQTLEIDIEQEKAYKWRGNIGLINPSDYIKASIDTSCTSLYNSQQSSYPCKNNNYLFTGYAYWAISPFTNGNSYNVRFVDSAGGLSSNRTNNSYGVHPVIHLKSNITLSGEGTSTNPYKIEGQ